MNSVSFNFSVITSTQFFSFSFLMWEAYRYSRDVLFWTQKAAGGRCATNSSALLYLNEPPKAFIFLKWCTGSHRSHLSLFESATKAIHISQIRYLSHTSVFDLATLSLTTNLSLTLLPNTLISLWLSWRNSERIRIREANNCSSVRVLPGHFSVH
jgi:hypothetical protein